MAGITGGGIMRTVSLYAIWMQLNFKISVRICSLNNLEIFSHVLFNFSDNDLTMK